MEDSESGREKKEGQTVIERQEKTVAERLADADTQPLPLIGLDGKPRHDEAERILANLDTQPLPQIVLADQANGQEKTTSAAPADGKDEPFSKYEFDLFRDVLSNVNNTLRFQLSLNVPLLAACITVLNIVPPTAHQALINELDRYVFIPVVISMVLSYVGLERYAVYPKEGKLKLDLEVLYNLVRYKYRMVHLAQLFQAVGLVLFGIFVLIEYK